MWPGDKIRPAAAADMLQLSDPYANISPFDGSTSVPPLFVAFCTVSCLLGGRLGSLKLFPFQPSIDVAFKTTVLLDAVVWAASRTFPEVSLVAPAGPLHLAVVFLPQQALFCLALSFRREVPFMSVFYAVGLLFAFVATYTWFAVVTSVNWDVIRGEISVTHRHLDVLGVSVIERKTCAADETSALALTSIAAFLGLRALLRPLDRMSMLLVVWASLGVVTIGNCVANVMDKGGAVLLAQIAGLLIVKMLGGSWWSTPGSSSLSYAHGMLRDSKRVEPSSIKKVAMVLDGFIGPDCVVCGISRTYASWIHELVAQGREVIIYSAFDAASIEFFAEGDPK